jgi:hypothetical protein
MIADMLSYEGVLMMNVLAFDNFNLNPTFCKFNLDRPDMSVETK